MSNVKSKRRTGKGTKKGARNKLDIPVMLIPLVLIVGLVVSLIVLSGGRHQQQQAYYFGKDVAVGIDVSQHNGDIDWDIVSESQDFAFIRVGYRGYGDGKIHEDKAARDNLRNAEKSGMPFGVYFYTQAVNEKEAQEEADFVYNIIKKYNVELPIVIDFEYATDSDGNATGRLAQAGNDSSTNAKIINAFTSRLKDKGYICGVYASSSVLAHRISTKKLDSDTVVWVADYNNSVTYNVDYTIWQYSETGSCNGVSSKYVDLDYWYE